MGMLDACRNQQFYGKVVYFELFYKNEENWKSFHRETWNRCNQDFRKNDMLIKLFFKLPISYPCHKI